MQVLLYKFIIYKLTIYKTFKLCKPIKIQRNKEYVQFRYKLVSINLSNGKCSN